MTEIKNPLHAIKEIVWGESSNALNTRISVDMSLQIIAPAQ